MHGRPHWPPDYMSDLEKKKRLLALAQWLDDDFMSFNVISVLWRICSRRSPISKIIPTNPGVDPHISCSYTLCWFNGAWVKHWEWHLGIRDERLRVVMAQTGLYPFKLPTKKRLTFDYICVTPITDETGGTTKQTSNGIEMDQMPNGSRSDKRQSKDAADDDDSDDDDIYEPPVRNHWSRFANIDLSGQILAQWVYNPQRWIWCRWRGMDIHLALYVCKCIPEGNHVTLLAKGVHNEHIGSRSRYSIGKRLISHFIWLWGWIQLEKKRNVCMIECSWSNVGWIDLIYVMV